MSDGPRRGRTRTGPTRAQRARARASQARQRGLLQTCLEDLRTRGGITRESSNRLQSEVRQQQEIEMRLTDDTLADSTRNLLMGRLASIRSRVNQIGKISELSELMDRNLAEGKDASRVFAALLKQSEVDIGQRFPAAELHINSTTQEVYGLVYENPTARRVISEADQATFNMIEREMRNPGSTGSAELRETGGHITKVWNSMAQRLRERGFDLETLDNYFPQKLDPQKMIDPAIGGAASKQLFREVMFAELDRPRMKGRMGEVLNDTRLGELLDEVFDEVTSNRALSVPTSSASGGGFRINRPHSRILHYKDADSALRVREKFGLGTAGENYLDHTRYLARQLALVEKFGPNYNLTFRFLRNKLARADPVATGPSRIALDQLTGYSDAIWDELIGTPDYAVNPNIALVGQTYRNLRSAAKLGLSPLTALGDLLTSARQIARVGGKWARVFGDWMRAFLNPQYERQIAELANDLGHHLTLYGIEKRRSMDALLSQKNLGGTSAAHRYIRGAHETSERFRDFTITASGLERNTRIAKNQAWIRFSNFLGDNASLEFGALDETLQRYLRVYNIGPAEWARLRTAVIEMDGVKYMLPERIEDRELRSRLHGYLLSRVDRSVLEGTALTAAVGRRLGRSGSIISEFVTRPFFQFKQFAVTSLFNLIDEFTIASTTASGRWLKFASLNAQNILMGFWIAAAKQFALGERPDFDNLPRWFTSNIQRGVSEGGLLSFAGDYISDRQSFIRNFTGRGLPLFDLVEFMVQSAGHMWEGDFGRPISKIASNTPGANFWYSRLVIQRMFTDKLEDLVDVNGRRREAWNRLEARARESGREYYWGRSF